MEVRYIVRRRGAPDNPWLFQSVADEGLVESQKKEEEIQKQVSSYE